MSEEESAAEKAVKLARKVGAVTAAAAALLTQTPARSHQSDLYRGVLNKAAVTAVSVDLAAPVRELPPPLLLTPSDGDGMLVAGHRSHASHRSHSSHRSHVSGSSHASHYSASSGPISVTPAQGNAPATRKKSAPKQDDNGAIAEPKNTPTTIPAEKPLPPSKPAAPVRDLSDPAQRFRLIGIGGVGGEIKAKILDFKTEEIETLRLHGKIDDFELIRIDVAKRRVELKSPNVKSPVVLKLKSLPPGEESRYSK